MNFPAMIESLPIRSLPGTFTKEIEGWAANEGGRLLAQSAQRMLDIIKMEYPDIYTALQQYEKGLEPSTFSFIADMDEKSLQLAAIDGASCCLLQ